MRPLFAALLVLSLAACDGGNAIDAPTPADVAGLYTLSALRFVPDASALAPVDVRSELVAADSYLELTDGGQAVLRFRRTGGTVRLVPGTFEVRRRELRVTFDGGNGETLARVLLPQVLTFSRDEVDALTLAEDYTADLAAYDPARYAGFRSVDGTLTVAFAAPAGVASAVR